MYYKIFSIILAIFLFIPASVVAETATDKVVEAGTAAVGAEKSAAELPAVELTYERMFNRALSKINNGKEGEASVILEGIRAKAFEEEYLNLSGLSVSLLERAKQESVAGNHVQARYLVSWAEKLSPEDSRIQLGIVSLKDSLGNSAAFSALWKSFKFATMSPLFAVSYTHLTLPTTPYV